MNTGRKTSPKNRSRMTAKPMALTSPRRGMNRFNDPRSPKRTIEDRQLDQEISSAQFTPGAILLRVGEFNISKKKTNTERFTASFANEQMNRGSLVKSSIHKSSFAPDTPEFRKPDLSFAFLEPGFETPIHSNLEDHAPRAPANSERRPRTSILGCLHM